MPNEIITVNERWQWVAYFDDYDGAPDGNPQQRIVGTGQTEAEAIADLLDKREL